MSWWGSSGRSTLGDGDGRRTGREVTLSGDDLVIVGTQVQAIGLPGVDVVGEGDGSAGTLVAADGPVLLEGGGTNDGWLVGTGGDEEIVDGSIGGNGTSVGSTRRWVVGTEVLNDIVLNQWVLGPSVNSEIRVTFVAVAALVADDSISKLV